ncbi:MAG: hypothetical protein ACLP7Q_14470 [Isosphaeraceae bacterium]
MADEREDPDEDGDDGSLFFTDGFVVRRDAVVIPAQFNRYPDETLSRVLFLFGDEWFYHDFSNADVRSVTYRDGLCYLMGMNGVVHSVGRSGQALSPATMPGSYREIVVPLAPDYGNLSRIRFIEESVYACGQSSQVYVLGSGRWKHLDDGIRQRGGSTFEDIDGTGPDDIYAVGWKGTICHYDGKRWARLDSPTNQHLSNVRCVSREEVYVCGKSGSLFCGNADGWQFVGDPDFTESFWGMTVFEEQLFLAHNLGLMKHDGNELVPLAVDIGKTLSCHRLHGADGVLWSFGEKELLRFDGAAWAEVVCPENAP